MNKKVLISIITTLIILITLFMVFFWFPSQYKNTIKIERHKINYFKAPTKVASILVFGDLHLTYDYNVKDLDNLVNTINQIKPDIIIFNGDLFEAKTFSKQDRTKEIAKLTSKLKSIKVLHGKFALYGEQDYLIKNSKSILENADFEILTNVNRTIKINDYSFNLGALNEKANLDKLFSSVSDKTFNFVITHAPERLEEITKYKVDLLVYNHTNGGEYNLPFYGSLYQDIRKYKIYRKIHNIDNVKVYNNRGIGTSHSKMRFNASSSVDLFELY